MPQRLLPVLCLLASATASLAQPSVRTTSTGLHVHPVAAVGEQRGEDAAVDLVVPDTLYIGLTRVGACDTVAVPVRNRGSDSVIIDSISVGGELRAVLAVLPAVPGLGTGATTGLRIVFCPNDIGCADGDIIIGYHGSAVTPPSTHRIGLQACAGSAQPDVDRTTLDYGNVRIRGARTDSVAIINQGTFPLEVSAAAVHVSAFTIVDGTTLFPLIVPPGGRRSVHIRFAPQAEGAYNDTITFTGNANIPIPRVHLTGHAFVPGIDLPELIDMGELAIGACRDTVVMLRNLSLKAMLIDRPVPAGGAGAFQWIEPNGAALPVILQPGDSIPLRLRFCAAGIGPVSGSGSVEIDSLPFDVAFAGKGVVPTLLLDTARTTPGGIAALTLRLAPGLRGVTIGSYAITIAIPPEALSLMRMQSPDGTIAASASDGRIAITGISNVPLAADEVLARIDLRGLSSGDPFNLARILSASIPLLDTLGPAIDGAVFLDGCDIAHPIRLGPRLAVRGVAWESPGRIAVTYVAPTGTPVLSLYDANGRRLAVQTLPEGSGNVQHAQLAANPPAGEPCFIELLQGDERSVTPIILPR